MLIACVDVDGIGMEGTKACAGPVVPEDDSEKFQALNMKVMNITLIAAMRVANNMLSMFFVLPLKPSDATGRGIGC